MLFRDLHVLWWYRSNSCRQNWFISFKCRNVSLDHLWVCYTWYKSWTSPLAIWCLTYDKVVCAVHSVCIGVIHSDITWSSPQPGVFSISGVCLDESILTCHGNWRWVNLSKSTPSTIHGSHTKYVIVNISNLPLCDNCSTSKDPVNRHSTIQFMKEWSAKVIK
jgi:hypothetical protein